MTKTLSFKKNKIMIKDTENGFTIYTESSGRRYGPMTADDIEEVKSIAFEMADNNDIGLVLSRKVHDWYYSR